MTGSSVDEDRMVAERLLAEQLIHRADEQRGSLPMSGAYEITPRLTTPTQGASN